MFFALTKSIPGGFCASIGLRITLSNGDSRVNYPFMLLKLSCLKARVVDV